jgi:hypothetical protein
MFVQNAIIKAATLTNDDHGCLSSWLQLDYGNSGQGFGGYALYLPKSYKHHDLQSVAGHWIWRCMEIADVSSWDKLTGKTIRVRLDREGLSGRIEAIGHIVKDNWFCPRIEFESGQPTRDREDANG